MANSIEVCIKTFLDAEKKAKIANDEAKRALRDLMEVAIDYRAIGLLQLNLPAIRHLERDLWRLSQASQ
jgi:hypothetical protein